MLVKKGEEVQERMRGIHQERQKRRKSSGEGKNNR
jgi:hypothetical protein